MERSVCLSSENLLSSPKCSSCETNKQIEGWEQKVVGMQKGWGNEEGWTWWCISLLTQMPIELCKTSRSYQTTGCHVNERSCFQLATLKLLLFTLSITVAAAVEKCRLLQLQLLSFCGQFLSTTVFTVPRLSIWSPKSPSQAWARLFSKAGKNKIHSTCCGWGLLNLLLQQSFSETCSSWRLPAMDLAYMTLLRPALQ